MTAKSTLERNKPSPRYILSNAVESFPRGGAIGAVSSEANAMAVSRVNGKRLFAGRVRVQPIRAPVDDFGAHHVVIDPQPDARRALGLGIDHAIGDLTFNRPGDIPDA